MIKKLGLTSIAFSALLLSGCGGGSSNTNDNTPSSASTLVGTWSSACENYNGYSFKYSLIFTNSVLELIDKEYNGDNCDENEINAQVRLTYNYTSGVSTKYSNGTDAIELDITLTGTTDNDGGQIGEKSFLMYNIDGNKLYLSEEDEAEEFDGTTAAKRSKEFDSSFLTKQ